MNNTEINEIKVNGVDYIRKDSVNNAVMANQVMVLNQ